MANFGDIPSNVVLAAGQSIRRNAANDAFEAYTPGGGGTVYTFQHSLVEAAGVVNLVNDSASPGNSKYYGTNGSGTRGFYDLPIVPTFSNGLTLATGNVKLGGTLQNATTIDIDDKSLWIESSGSLLNIYGPDDWWIVCGDVSPGNTQHDIYISDTAFDLSRFTDSTSIIYSLTANGLVENADYSSIYGDRTLVARGWVNAQLTNKANWDTAYGWGNHASANYFKQNGNAFGAAAVLGTTDNYDLQLYANNIQWGVLKNTGEVGIGRETTAQQRLTVNYGNLRFNSIPQPAGHTASLAGVGAGNLSNGLYYYTVIPVTIYGDCGYDQRSLSSVTVVDNTVNGQVQLTNIPVFAAKYQVIARKLYRTKVGESLTSPRYLTIINDNTTTTYLDNTADTSLPDGRVYGKPDMSTGVLYKDGALMFLADTYNTFIGQGAAANQTSVDGCTVIGAFAGEDLTSGLNNTLIGNRAGYNLTTGAANVAIGAYTLAEAITGTYNIAIGGGMHSVSATGSYNIALGREAGGLTSGDCNIYIGRYAGRYQGSGLYNIALGSNVFHGVSGTTPTGSYNLVMGYIAMGSGALTSAQQNVALGYLSLRFATTASSNVAVGTSSGTSITTGGLNVFIGQSAGSSITGGSRNLILGASVNVSSGTVNDEFRLGYSTTLLLNGHMGTGPFLNVPVEFRTAGDVVFNGIGTATESNILYYNTSTKKVTYGAAPSSSVSFGTEGQIPYTNATVDDFDYSSKFSWNNSSGILQIDQTLRSPDSTGTGVAGKDLTIRAGNANFGDATSLSGDLYLAPGQPYSTSIVPTVYLGASHISSTSIILQTAASGSNVNLMVRSKGTGFIQLGSGSTNVTVSGPLTVQGETILVGNYAKLGDITTGSYSIYGTDGISGYATGMNVTLRGGNAYATGDNNGGHLYLYGGAPNGTGSRGNVYFGNGATGYLPAKSSETNVIHYDTVTGKLSYGVASAGTTYTFQHSLTETTGTVNLINDTASPGNSKLYGTNGSGTRGWYDIPAAMAYPGSGVAISTGSAWSTSVALADFVRTTQANTYGDFAQTFKDDSIRINNPADTFYYTITAGAIGANRVLNLPVITDTDTLAVLGLEQTWTAKQIFLLQPSSSIGSTTITINSGNYTSYAGRVVWVSYSGDVTFTIETSVPNGFHATFVRAHTYEVAFAQGSGLTIVSSGSKKRINLQYEAAYMFKYSDSNCLLSGSLKT